MTTDRDTLLRELSQTSARLDELPDDAFRERSGLRDRLHELQPCLARAGARAAGGAA